VSDVGSRYVARTVMMSILALLAVVAGCTSTGEKRPATSAASVAGGDKTCLASDVYVGVRCPEPTVATMPTDDSLGVRLLGRDGKPESCTSLKRATDLLAQLEAQVDAQGRLIRARVTDSKMPCDSACIEASYSRAFLPPMRAGRTTPGEVKLLCRRKVREKT
jgi:hypothetical protein